MSKVQQEQLDPLDQLELLEQLDSLVLKVFRVLKVTKVQQEPLEAPDSQEIRDSRAHPVRLDLLGLQEVRVKPASNELLEKKASRDLLVLRD